MTLKGGSSHACAACKFQRRKCSSECMLAQFFPSDNPKLFQNAHRLFGVRNIVKILKPLNSFERWEAMTSIIFQSNMREEFPVLGCCHVIRKLEYEICAAQEELNSVQAQLAFFRQNQQQQEISCTQNDSLSDLQLGMVNLGPPDQQIPRLPTETNQVYQNGTVVDFGSVYPEKNEMVNSYCIQNPDTNGNDICDGEDIKLIQTQINSQAVPIQQQEPHEYDEIHPFFDMIDDRQSFIDSKEANDSSSDSSLKHAGPSIEFVSDNELKNAAQHFSLTSVK